MQISNRLRQCQSPNFKGLYLANSTNYIKNVKTSIDIYEITSRDKEFLKALKQSIKFENLFPDKNITKQGFDRWHDILGFAVNKLHFDDYKGLIAVKENKPCGILAYKPGKSYYLDSICTWPVETGKKVPLAGQTMFKQLFSEFLKINGIKIELTAIQNGPFPVIHKYLRLGFKPTGGEDYLVRMRAFPAEIRNTMKYLNEIIFTKNINDNENINLFNKLVV